MKRRQQNGPNVKIPNLLYQCKPRETSQLKALVMNVCNVCSLCCLTLGFGRTGGINWCIRNVLPLPALLEFLYIIWFLLSFFIKGWSVFASFITSAKSHYSLHVFHKYDYWFFHCRICAGMSMIKTCVNAWLLTVVIRVVNITSPYNFDCVVRLPC